MQIFYTRRAADDLQRLPQTLQRRIAAKMRFFAAQADPLRFAKRLTRVREGQFRFRIGDYRVIFDVEGDTIYVLKIAKRDDVYF